MDVQHPSPCLLVTESYFFGQPLLQSLYTQRWEHHTEWTISSLFPSPKRLDLLLIGKGGSLPIGVAILIIRALNYYGMKPRWREAELRKRSRRDWVCDIIWVQLSTLPKATSNLDFSVTWNCWGFCLLTATLSLVKRVLIYLFSNQWHGNKFWTTCSCGEEKKRSDL